jgi:copper oxidase (laccase) domain-containing protein
MLGPGHHLRGVSTVGSSLLQSKGENTNARPELIRLQKRKNHFITNSQVFSCPMKAQLNLLDHCVDLQHIDNRHLRQNMVHSVTRNNYSYVGRTTKIQLYEGRVRLEAVQSGAERTEREGTKRLLLTKRATSPRKSDFCSHRFAKESCRCPGDNF